MNMDKTMIIRILFAIVLAQFVIAIMALGGIAYFYFNIPTPNPITSKCIYNGITYLQGESFKSEDGCNSCSCYNGKIACTLMACGIYPEPTSPTPTFSPLPRNLPKPTPIPMPIIQN
jgi:hypothetical protein